MWLCELDQIHRIHFVSLVQGPLLELVWPSWVPFVVCTPVMVVNWWGFSLKLSEDQKIKPVGGGRRSRLFRPGGGSADWLLAHCSPCPHVHKVCFRHEALGLLHSCFHCCTEVLIRVTMVTRYLSDQYVALKCSYWVSAAVTNLPPWQSDAPLNITADKPRETLMVKLPPPPRLFVCCCSWGSLLWGFGDTPNKLLFTSDLRDPPVSVVFVQEI